ncbi:MAG TPA: Ni/Fe hydrogenase subunit alpha [Armatimonadota bacterium]|jgi:coenzyme F420-reducing hydrogenase alpha subunit
MKGRIIKVDTLARVEGEGSVIIKIGDDGGVDAKLKIYEPPRFFEAFLRGRSYAEAPDITARICGICPIAYQMSAVHAVEAAFGITVGGQLRALRRLLYCGEWIESHVLHVFLLHAPDFLGYQDAIAMAKDHGPLVEKALRLKKVGNDIVALLGGREIHPINVRVGGFYKTPRRQDLDTLVDRLKWAQDAALETVPILASLPFPDFEGDYEFVALRHPDEYPMNEGRIVSSRGLDIPVSDYEACFVEEQVAHSNALHSVRKGKGSYCVGPLARFNLNSDRLPAAALQAARAANLTPGCRNPFKSILARAVETVCACEEALRIIAEYEPPAEPAVEVIPLAGSGCACTEAPRGILYHRYRIDAAGLIADARIVPPTAQNQRTIEDDLRRYVAPRVELPIPDLTWQCEQAVRNYDPCISCATHFLRLEAERR